MQLARYLIEHNLANSEKMTFEDGELKGFGISKEKVDDLITLGLPFMTSGCPGKTMENACNRPYANETPGQAAKGLIRNYPFPPEKKDLKKIREQMK
jgi:biotin synthase